MKQGEQGLTIIEVLIAMMLMLLIMAPLSVAFIVGLSTTRSSEQDAGNSSDAQLLAAFFDIDVSSAETVTTNPLAMSCGGEGGVLQLRWTVGSGLSAVDQHVTYRAVADADRQAFLQLPTPVYRLERVVCSDDNGTMDGEVQTVARTLKSPPAIECDDQSCSATPRRITMRAQGNSTQLSDDGSTTTYTFGITATRKVQP